MEGKNEERRWHHFGKGGLCKLRTRGSDLSRTCNLFSSYDSLVIISRCVVIRGKDDDVGVKTMKCEIRLT